MRLALLTNIDQKCGNAEYGRNLYNELQKKVETAVFRPEEYKEAALYGDVVFVNWHPAKVHIDCQRVQWMHDEGSAKVILIYQNSRHELVDVQTGDLLDLVDAIVAHEPFQVIVWNAEQQFAVKPVTYIPHGIPVVEGMLDCPWSDLVLGTAGFAFPWKRFDVVIEAARRHGSHANIVCPAYPPLVDPDVLERQWMSILGARLRMEKGWLTEEHVVRRLALSTINIFWYESKDVHDQFGQTGSARLGLAARRPVIVSRHRKYRMLLEEYPREVYIAETEDDVYRLVGEIWEELKAGGNLVKYPVQVSEEQSWAKAGERYWNLIESVCAPAKEV